MEVEVGGGGTGGGVIITHIFVVFIVKGLYMVLFLGWNSFSDHCLAASFFFLREAELSTEDFPPSTKQTDQVIKTL